MMFQVLLRLKIVGEKAYLDGGQANQRCGTKSAEQDRDPDGASYGGASTVWKVWVKVFQQHHHEIPQN